MDEQKRFVTAYQAAQLLLADLREVQCKTDSLAIEELALGMIRDVVEISRVLGRLGRKQGCA